MAFELRINNGTLFANKQKQDGDNRPDATGPMLVECPHCKAQTRYELSAWTKVPKAGGKKFMSLTVKVAKGGVTPPKQPSASDATTGAEPSKPPEERVAF